MSYRGRNRLTSVFLFNNNKSKSEHKQTKHPPHEKKQKQNPHSSRLNSPNPTQKVGSYHDCSNASEDSMEYLL